MEAALQEAPKRYSYAGPPSINFGTWSERPKSEVSLKCDSDYRIGMGQAPRVKDTSVYIAHSICKSDQSSQYEQTPPCPPPKPSNHVVVNIVSATKQEPISRLPIVRSVELKKTSTLSRTDRPLSGSFLNDLREELTGALASLVDANRNGVSEEGNERRRRQQIPSSAVPPPPPDVTSVRLPNQTTSLRRMGSTAGMECGPRINGYGGIEKRHMLAPVVKGFRVNSISATNVTNIQCQPPQPPPPPAVVCGVALKKKMSTIPKFSENPRDELLTAIREFGGRESLKKTAINFK
ncbi:hypothetical protein J437_LFUL011699 [Ladona fulva]|uniref:WH2 domain-containing protein n=1 Tax=Ladona fulva TaxID=123851 RepID=A0A8K0P9L6_LADFU|nr:hypothetical protein J437_LFUL011699 [Ladona fulva]